MKSKLNLGDKIRKFFGQEGCPGRESPVFAGPASARERSFVEGGVGATHSISAHGGGGDWTPVAAGDGGAKAGGAPCRNLVSVKADLTSNMRTTGGHVGCGDPASSLQSEVCFPQLLETLAGGGPEQRAVAAEALFNFTAESEAARQRATAAGVVAHLTELLLSGTDHARMYAAYTLSSLTSIDEAIAQMRQQRAPAALVGLLAGCPLLVCKKGAMRALGRLARNDDTAAEIVAAGGLRPIVSLLAHGDASLVRRCLVALYFIGADKPELQAELGAVPGAIAQLVSLLRSDNADVRAEAADVIKVVARSPACAGQVLDHGGAELLAALAAGTIAAGGGGLSTGLSGSAQARTRASAARALQRLNELPELRAQLSEQLGTGLHGQPASASGGGDAAALLDEVASASEGDDVRELVEAVARGSPNTRAKAAAAIEQVATDPTAAK
jgi:hypothetical protein